MSPLDASLALLSRRLACGGGYGSDAPLPPGLQDCYECVSCSGFHSEQKKNCTEVDPL